MKKVLGIILIVIGIIILPQVISPSGAETVGALIGVVLFTFLPAFFLLKPKKKEEK